MFIEIERLANEVTYLRTFLICISLRFINNHTILFARLFISRITLLQY